MTPQRLEPLQQGQDRLCSLYAVLNSFRLALADCAPLTGARCKELFDEGISYLHRNQVLEAAVIGGMGKRRWYKLARHLAKKVSTSNCQVVVEQADRSAISTIEDAFEWIDASLADGPVMVALMGGMGHYTVVVGTTAKTLRLFDSTGMKSVRKSSCSFQYGGHHEITTDGLLRVVVRSSG